MSDDSRNTPEQGGDAPEPIEPPQGAISDGDDQPDGAPSADPGETQPIRSDAPPPPPPPTPVPAEPAPPAQPAPPADSATTAIPVVPPTPVVADDAGRGPLRPELPLRASRAGSTGAIVAVGTGLLAAAVAIAGFRARSDGDLDWSNYGTALAATAALLAIAVLGSLTARAAGGRAREEIVTWPGVAGILSTAVVIGIGIDEDDNWVAYLIGGVMIALAVVGYVAARRAAFVVVAILGLVLIYAVAIDDVLPDSVGEDHPGLLAGVLITLFVVVVTLLGWALPSRAVSGVVVGAIGLIGLVGVMAAFVAFRYLGMFFGAMFSDDEFGTSSDDSMFSGANVDVGFKEADVWWVLALAAVLVVLWALAASLTNHSGFTILAIAAPAILVPLASAAVAAEHPTAWAGVLAGAGGVVLLGGAFLARQRERRTASELSV
ncbi:MULTISPECIES: hypothetical protein [unclassified Nocardioides]|uniref:hypothetical protein n=1 Tax=unclassified Nocardioides TaxID=2615069 RepID=UPI000703A025|nr:MULTISPECIES: hypothetical protein [unclassified Nocardioides]KRC57394.1 hypothetical protein ASE19_24035 [Nocardioides sp. Root79]KRC74240.1 hypothetical protein ASE20_23995 [Nocardioides sp. Root240]